MNISVENFGVIRKADIDLSKSLIVFCGNNGTGKTYLAYLLYQILDNKYIDEKKGFEKDQIESLLKNGKVIIPIQEEDLHSFTNHIEYNIESSLGDLFALSDDDVKKLFNEVKIKIETPSSDEIYHISFNTRLKIGGIEFKIEKKTNEINYTIECKRSSESSDQSAAPMYKEYCKHILYSTAYRFLIMHPLRKSYLLPVERNSIYTFNKELSLSRNMFIEQMQKLATLKKLNPLDFLNDLQEKTNRYPKAIVDGLQVANDLNTIKKNTGDFAEIAIDIEKQLMRGELSTSSEGDVILKIKRNRTQNKLPIHITSSLVKTTSSLVFYLKHILKKGDLIIIDEPEMNLHPDSQLELVRIIIRLMKEGLRFVISTHSDYIIRELNKYIMLDSITKQEHCIPEHYDNSCAINIEQVGFYYFTFSGRDKQVTVQALKHNSENCFSIPSIDDVIKKQNNEIEELYDILKYGIKDED